MVAPGASGQTSAKRGGRLTLAQIVQAAVDVADREGLDSLSMRAVAQQLGRPVMSLYRHVKDKDQLMVLALDAVFGEEPFPAEAPQHWRARLAESAHRQRRAYLRHPWIAPAISLVRPHLGKHGVAEMEWAFEGLNTLPLSPPAMLSMYLAVSAFVHGAAGQAGSELIESRRAGTDASRWWAEQRPVLAKLFATGEFPLVARLAGYVAPTPEEWFAQGLEAMLDGLEAQLPAPA